MLFVCEYNSCRSQLAEALARRVVPANWRVLSAGLTRTVVNEEVLRALEEVGMDATDLCSKSLDDVCGEAIDEVIVLAPVAVKAVRARFPAARVREWPMDDPIRAHGGPESVRAAVRAARDDLVRRMATWLDGRGTP